MKKARKVIILGSGALKIGEAGEFDYSGSQCIKALKEDGIKAVLVNPNIATIQTSERMADKVYFLPVSHYFVEKVIAKERPDGILLGFGGQTALNCGVALHDNGVLKRYNVQVLGTQIQAIKDTEDRDLFVKKLRQINLKTPKSKAVNTVSQAVRAAKNVGYPVMIRIAYALGGQGSGVARNKEDLISMAKRAFSYANQILVEEYLKGWKEVEYEVVRDRYDNCITVCNMENFDPMGIHTGESIVVAPSQTLTNREYHKLREIAIRLIRHLGIVGECNVQYALDPGSEDYRVIEVNARLSRSSALASKATGYPLAFIAAKLSLGYSLAELQNKITKKTMACFEPALDYIVVKIPRWDLQKFREVNKEIGSEMKSVGEVMAIGRKFEEVLQKALRMLGIGVHGLVGNHIEFYDIKSELEHPTDKRVFAVAEAIKKGHSIDEIYRLTFIDKWFLHKIKNIVETEKELAKHTLKSINEPLLRKAKEYGFSDFQIAKFVIKSQDGMQKKSLIIRKLRKKLGIIPVVKQIDTLAAEYPAKTNYLYLTYNGDNDDIKFNEKNKVIVLGGGAYRIGSSVEFDWCCVNAVMTARKLKHHTIIVNYNPETVSTDYDMCDKLYFDELTFERCLDIYEKERPLGVIVSMGGQIPNNLAMKLHKNKVRVLGTSPENIDTSENRHKFSKLLDSMGIDQPEWKELTSISEAVRFAKKAGYPVLVRPSYVLSGSAMNVAYTKKELVDYLQVAAEVSKEYPIVISKFIVNAKEIEIDAVANKGSLVMYAISEHVENAGVHSGDATMVFPPQMINIETSRKIKDVTKKIAKALKITGPFNIQFVAKENSIRVIECNLRASRSFPFVSKVLKLNLIDIATKLMLGSKVPKIERSAFELDYVGVKAPQFSFSRLKGADPLLGVEMMSTGEVACLGKDYREAFLKSILAAGFKMPKKNVFVSIGGYENKIKLLDSIVALKKLGFNIYATEHTHEFLDQTGVKNKMVYKAHNIEKRLNVRKLLMDHKVDLVINIPTPEDRGGEDEYLIRRLAVDFAIPLLTNLQITRLFVESLKMYGLDQLEIKDWDEYK